jgi:hypothetical protein
MRVGEKMVWHTFVPSRLHVLTSSQFPVLPVFPVVCCLVSESFPMATRLGIITIWHILSGAD